MEKDWFWLTYLEDMQFSREIAIVKAILRDLTGRRGGEEVSDFFATTLADLKVEKLQAENARLKAEIAGEGLAKLLSQPELVDRYEYQRREKLVREEEVKAAEKRGAESMARNLMIDEYGESNKEFIKKSVDEHMRDWEKSNAK